jgi:hypothetical protein
MANEATRRAGSEPAIVPQKWDAGCGCSYRMSRQLDRGVSALGQEREHRSITKGDIAILQLLPAAEIIETDQWQQYRELGGVEAMGGPSQATSLPLRQLDGDMPNTSLITPTMKSVT